MTKKASDINGWVFIGIGFIVIAVSIFFYDTLKFFIVIGGIMTIYGLGKLTYDKVEKQFAMKDDDWGPVDLNKAKNPYVEKIEQEKRNSGQQEQQRAVQQRAPQQMRQQQTHQMHYLDQTAHQEQRMSGRYCGSCGSPIAQHHRFCTQCGSRTT